MKSSYVNVEEGAVVHLMEITGGAVWIVTSVAVPLRRNRGKGAASRLLDVVLADADAEGIQLVLSVEPDSTDGLNFDELYDFYERHSFRDINGRSGLMYRNACGAAEPEPVWLMCF